MVCKGSRPAGEGKSMNARTLINWLAVLVLLSLGVVV